MTALKRFHIFGEPVEVLLTGDMTNGSLAVITQTCEPGGGPPPHSHTKEDEIFTVLEGDFEVFDGSAWRPLPRGQAAFGPRGGMHSFRNCGKTTGVVQIVASPAGLEMYLEAISTLQMPQDMEKLLEISREYGIAFAGQG